MKKSITHNSQHMMKPNKKDASEYVEQLYEKETDEDTLDLLRLLYKFFEPSKTAITKDPIKWVDKASADDGVRLHMQSLYSNGKRLSAVDGHRLHFAKTELEEGFYSKHGEKVEFNGNFPDIDRIIPEETQRVEINLKDFEITKAKGKYFYEIKSEDVTIAKFEKKYIDDVFNSEKVIFALSCFDEEKPILLENSIGRAVVMPYRL